MFETPYISIGYILIAILSITFLIQLYLYIHPYSSIIRKNKKEKKQSSEEDNVQPSVSIIICAKNESKNLQSFLPLIFEQEYSDYEVIVVNDGSFDDTVNILKDFQSKYNNLYVTNIPEDVNIISRKKLALTVGIKAAKNEILLLTDADCRPSSKHWISKMVSQFKPGTEFVLGIGDYLTEKSFINKLICYDTLTIAMQYIGFAAIGSPYMGVGRNIAYRRETFFNNNGFAGFLQISSGDDDLFVNHHATKHNTQTETSFESITLSIPKQTFKDWFHQKTRHLCSSKLYTTKSKYLVMIEPITKGLFYLSLLLLLIFYYNNYYLTIAGVSMYLIRYFTQLLVYNLTSKIYKRKNLYLSIILFDLLLPLINVYIFTIYNKLHKRVEYSW